MYKKLHKKYIAIILIAMLSTIFAFNVTMHAKSNKNAPYSTSSKTFKNNINGFFTADTWYRPKMINENGTHWRKSKSNEYRPLLTVWWPNKDIQMTYVTFMIQHSLGNGIQKLKEKTLKNEILLIQKNIEKRIYKTKSTKWLNKLIKEYINSQNEWNIKSEFEQPISIADVLQGGFFSYGNNKLTPYANSNYRFFGRNGKFQKGTGKTSQTAELLLANDIDNSNPTVQSEQLNLLHYLTHFGSLTQKNKNANFDGVRLDAALNVDSDLLDLTKNYMNKVYKVNKNEYNADNHLTIYESPKVSDEDKDRITMNVFSKDALLKKPNERKNLKTIDEATNNYSNGFPGYNYTYVNSHDASDANDIFMYLISKDTKLSNKEIQEKINSEAKKYNNDRKLTNKKITQYNVPSAYSIILSQKNTVPRVYYGDLYNDTDKFMKTKSPYYKSIEALMLARKKYVSGEYNKNIVSLNDGSEKNQLLNTIRYGKTRTQGIANVVNANPNFKPNEKIKISMGEKHSNQQFRPLLKSTKNGIKIYKNDKDINSKEIKKTDKNGDFYLNVEDVNGVNNPQVSGYLSTWVPMGAKNNQDARTKPSKKIKKNKTVYEGDALDSNLIYEGFSSYQAKEKNPSTYRKIAKNAKLFNQLGITYYEFPPTYRSSKGNSFQDETFENGYAIKDRYDYGFKTPTKYGTAKELTKSIESLHKNNVKAMADYVPNQIYDLPKQEVVDITRTDWFGNYIGNNTIKDRLYATHSKGSGKDYQAKFGGKYLKELKKKYPSIFKQKQISTGKTIDNSGKRIKTWSAKYLNGTNIQGRGSDYVLRDDSTGKYYKVGEGKHIPNNFLK